MPTFHVHAVIYVTHTIEAHDAHDAACRLSEEGEEASGKADVTGYDINKVTAPVPLDRPLDEVPDLRDDEHACLHARTVRTEGHAPWRVVDARDANGTSIDGIVSFDNPTWGKAAVEDRAGRERTARQVAEWTLQRQPTSREVLVAVGWLLDQPDTWYVSRADLAAAFGAAHQQEQE